MILKLNFREGKSIYRVRHTFWPAFQVFKTWKLGQNICCTFWIHSVLWRSAFCEWKRAHGWTGKLDFLPMHLLLCDICSMKKRVEWTSVIFLLPSIQTDSDIAKKTLVALQCNCQTFDLLSLQQQTSFVYTLALLLFLLHFMA